MPTVTYSPAYTLVPTYECFNRCSYCNFRREPGNDRWLTPQAARHLLTPLADRGVTEILLLSGEVHPASPRRSAWLERIVELCQVALELGFWPHTNAGPLSREEMARLGKVNASMGLMLEQVTPRLLDTVHRHAPSKRPSLRLAQLELAGELRIPFTTGLLLGVGETIADRRDTLNAIAQVHRRWGHIQEVILQPYRPGDRQAEFVGFSENADHDLSQDLSDAQLIETVAIARAILPEDITIQVPPNLLARPASLLACLEAGARDLGGLGPRDEVNPNYDHPDPAELAPGLAAAGWQLVARLPVYPHYQTWGAQRGFFPLSEAKIAGYG